MDDQQILANLAKDFHELVSNEEELRTSVENFFDNLIDEMTLGVIFDEHRKFKTGICDCLKNENDEDIAVTEVDVFNQPTDQKLQYYCACPNCDRSVAAEKFTPHLASCMEIGRTRSSRQGRTSGNDSKDQASGTSSRQGPSKHRVGEDLTSSVKREKQQQHSKNKDDTTSTSGYKRGKKKQYKKSSQESPNNLSSTGISVDTDTKVDNFDQLNVEEIQQYYICPKCDFAVDVEEFTPHLDSCRCGPNRKEFDGNISKSQEYDTFLLQGTQTRNYSGPNNSLTPDLTDSVSKSCLREISERKRKEKVRYSP